ncbi:hypothetical protein [Campylobacter showae]|nr:hypothetical protein [Campylobacter showae]
MHNPAANKAPFTNTVKLADQDDASGGHAETSRKFTAPKRQHKQT